MRSAGLTVIKKLGKMVDEMEAAYEQMSDAYTLPSRSRLSRFAQAKRKLDTLEAKRLRLASDIRRFHLFRSSM